MTGHPNNLTKGLQGKDNLITEIKDNKTFKIKLRLWESQLKLHNLVHSSHLTSLDTICPERIQEFSQSFFDSRRVRRMIPGLHNSKSKILVITVPLKADTDRTPYNVQMELICNATPILTRSSLKENCKTLISACQKKNFPAQIPWVNDCLARFQASPAV